jgi:hypothetical protein
LISPRENERVDRRVKRVGDDDRELDLDEDEFGLDGVGEVVGSFS